MHLSQQGSANFIVDALLIPFLSLSFAKRRDLYFIFSIYRMFIKIEKVLFKSLKKNGILDKIDEGQIFDVAVAVIADILGSRAIIKIKPMKIENKTLYLASLSDIFSQRIKQYEKKILWELNSPFHRQVISKIVIKN